MKRPRKSAKAAQTIPAKAAPPPVSPKFGRLLAVLEPLSVAALFIFLFWKSWLRWPDPLIDFPRELYTAWRLSEGDLLYLNVQSWYGPLPHMVEGAAFYCFGPGLDTIAWLNVGVTICALLLVRGIFGQLGNRLGVWLCSVVFLGVFAFGQYVMISNFNFITPYASQATYGFTGCLLTLWALVRHVKSNQPRWLWLAGAGLGVAYLSKLELWFADAGSIAFYLLVAGLHAARQSSPTVDWGRSLFWLRRPAVSLAGGFFCAWTPVFLVLAAQGGFRYAAVAANKACLVIFASSFAQNAASNSMRRVFGFDAPWHNFLAELSAGGRLVLIGAALALGGVVWARARAGGLVYWVALGMVVTAVALAGWLVHWLALGQAVVFPAVLAGLVLAVVGLRSAWRNEPGYAHTLGLATVGVAASLLLWRIILNGNIELQGFFLEPLAAFFLLHLLVVEIPRWFSRGVRAEWLCPAAGACLILIGAVRLGKISYDRYAQKTYAVGVGRDRFYTYPPESWPNGYLLNEMMEAVKTRFPATRTLIAFPDTSAVDYHLRLVCPVPQIEFYPVPLDFGGRDKVMADLRAHPPDTVILYARDLDDYGAPFFGYDEYSGREITLWLYRNYAPAYVLTYGDGRQKNPVSITGNTLDVFTRSVPAAPSAP